MAELWRYGRRLTDSNARDGTRTTPTTSITSLHAIPFDWRNVLFFIYSILIMHLSRAMFSSRSTRTRSSGGEKDGCGRLERGSLMHCRGEGEADRTTSEHSESKDDDEKGNDYGSRVA